MTIVGPAPRPLAGDRAARAAAAGARPGSGPAVAGGAHPVVRVGAPATGGLSLPSANPTAAHLYAPRGVWLEEHLLVVADSGNHRIMIWHGVPMVDEQPADVVLCQPDVRSEGPAAGGRGPANGVHLPTGVMVHDGALYVADAWHHRVLVWGCVPTSHDTPPDGVIGQPDLTAVEPNQGGEAPTAGTLYWPYGLGVVAGTFWITDTGNRRVLGWHLARGAPGGRPADVVLGQPDAESREENRGADVAGDSFRWPHDVAGTDEVLFVADAGNHRVVLFAPPPSQDRPADAVLGQPDLVSAVEWPFGPHSAAGHRFPYGISRWEDRLVVADTANNRILVWDTLPGGGEPAERVLAQPDFASNGENRWDAVADDTLCWPYGLCLHREQLAIADSGNNRVMLWDVALMDGRT